MSVLVIMFLILLLVTLNGIILVLSSIILIIIRIVKIKKGKKVTVVSLIAIILFFVIGNICLVPLYTGLYNYHQRKIKYENLTNGITVDEDTFKDWFMLNDRKVVHWDKLRFLNSDKNGEEVANLVFEDKKDFNTVYRVKNSTPYDMFVVDGIRGTWPVYVYEDEIEKIMDYYMDNDKVRTNLWIGEKQLVVRFFSLRKIKEMDDKYHKKFWDMDDKVDDIEKVYSVYMNTSDDRFSLSLKFIKSKGKYYYAVFDDTGIELNSEESKYVDEQIKKAIDSEKE